MGKLDKLISLPKHHELLPAQRDGLTQVDRMAQMWGNGFVAKIMAAAEVEFRGQGDKIAAAFDKVQECGAVFETIAARRLREPEESAKDGGLTKDEFHELNTIIFTIDAIGQHATSTKELRHRHSLARMARRRAVKLMDTAPTKAELKKRVTRSKRQTISGRG